MHFRDIMVQMESLVSGHTFNKIRPRLADKLEVIRFDPFSKWNIFCNSHYLKGHQCYLYGTYDPLIVDHKFNVNFPFSVQKECVYREKKKVRSM